MKTTVKTLETLSDQFNKAAMGTVDDRRETTVPMAASLAEPGSAESSYPEVLEMAERRSFSLEYKRKILKEAEGCAQPGEIGALLRREGLYSSHLTTWRRQVENGIKQALSSKKRGPVNKKPDPASHRIRELESELQIAKGKLKQAELIIEAQKKIAEILQIANPSIQGI